MTLNSARYMNYKLQAAQFVNKTGNISDVDVVELIVTMIYTTYDMRNDTDDYNQSYAITVLTRNNLLALLILVITTAATQKRRNLGGNGGAHPRNAETARTKVSVRPRNNLQADPQKLE